jgi:hypothetical protein
MNFTISRPQVKKKSTAGGGAAPSLALAISAFIGLYVFFLKKPFGNSDLAWVYL